MQQSGSRWTETAAHPPHNTLADEEALEKTRSDTPSPSNAIGKRGSFRRQSLIRRKGANNEDPFANEDSGDVKYRTLAWWQAALIMIAETISLGILSLPSVLARVGFAPGIVLILGLSVFATYSGYVLGQFKQQYPQVHTFADAGEILFAPIGMAKIGKEFFGAAQLLFLIFSIGSHLLTWTIMFSTITGGSVCAIVWSVIGLVLYFICNLPRTMKKLSWFSIACKLFATLPPYLESG